MRDVSSKEPEKPVHPPELQGASVWATSRSAAETVRNAAVGTRLGRTLQRYFGARGPILAAGISYTALFSLTAALTVGWTTFSLAMGENEALRDAVIDAANLMLPGLFQTLDDPGGLVDPTVVISEPGTSAAGLIALGIAIYTASTVVFYLARSIRSMFGLGAVVLSWWHNILHRLVGLFTLFMGVLTTAVLTMLNSYAHSSLHQQLGLDDRLWAFDIFSLSVLLVPFVVDFGIFIVMVRFVAAVRPPVRELVAGAFIAATGSMILRLLGSSVITGVSGPILRAAATLITLIVWVNLLAAIYLLACAWTANPPRLIPNVAGAYQHAHEVPNYVTMSAPHTLEWRDAKLQAAPPPLLASISPLLGGFRNGNGRSKARGQKDADHTPEL